VNSLLAHWFWALLTTAAVVWYSTITVYVAVRGLRDIAKMLDHLERSHREAPGSGP
jgi:hypothetical protein